MRQLRSVTAFLMLALVACGDQEPAAPADAGPAADAIPAASRHLPLAVGASWTWRVSEPGGATRTKTSTVEALEPVPGLTPAQMAYRVRTTGGDGDTVSWQVDTGAEIRRVREQSFSAAGALVSTQTFTPYKLRLDETADHLAAGASYTVSYSEVELDPVTNATRTTAKTESWTVEALAEAVTVPHGSHEALRVRRVGSDVGAADKTFWFVKGLGKVKETGGQIEELESYRPTAP